MPAYKVFQHILGENHPLEKNVKWYGLMLLTVGYVIQVQENDSFVLPYG